MGLLLLSRAGPAAQSFDAQLVANLRRVGIRDVTEGTRTFFGEPQLVMPRKRTSGSKGRALSSVDAVDEEQKSFTPEDDENSWERATFDAILGIGLISAVFIAFGLIVIRRRNTEVLREDKRKLVATTAMASCVENTDVRLPSSRDQCSYLFLNLKH